MSKQPNLYIEKRQPSKRIELGYLAISFAILLAGTAAAFHNYMWSAAVIASSGLIVAAGSAFIHLGLIRRKMLAAMLLTTLTYWIVLLVRGFIVNGWV
jgi:hypothetical protein